MADSELYRTTQLSYNKIDYRTQRQAKHRLEDSVQDSGLSKENDSVTRKKTQQQLIDEHLNTKTELGLNSTHKTDKTRRLKH